MDRPSLKLCSPPWLIGVVHLSALPGSPGASKPLDELGQEAAEDARRFEQAGFSAVLVENYHDTPFRPAHADPETVAAMTLATHAVCEAVSLPVGVQVLRNDGLAALAIATVTGASFIRVNVLSGAVVTDQGLIQGQADRILRRRAALSADVAILADVDVKHGSSLDTRPIPRRAADLVQRAGADAVLVTGEATGEAVDLDTLSAVAEACRPAPTLAASGTRPSNLAAVLSRCDGAIVGTAVQKGRCGRVDPSRARAWAEASRS